MNPEYEKRFDAAQELGKSLDEISLGAIIVGSVGNNPNGATDKSDLDITVIQDFSKLDFRKLYKKIHQSYDEVAVKAVQEGKANIIISRWVKGGFETGLNICDKQVLEQITAMSSKPVHVIREPSFSGVSRSEHIISMRGEPLAVNPTLKKEYEEGRIIQVLHPFFEDKNDIYVGVVLDTLLLSPHILFQHQNYMDNQLKNLNKKFAEHIVRKYGQKRIALSSISHLPENVAKKISPVVLAKFDDLIRNQ